MDGNTKPNDHRAPIPDVRLTRGEAAAVVLVTVAIVLAVLAVIVKQVVDAQPGKVRVSFLDNSPALVVDVEGIDREGDLILFNSHAMRMPGTVQSQLSGPQVVAIPVHDGVPGRTRTLVAGNARVTRDKHFLLVKKTTDSKSRQLVRLADMRPVAEFEDHVDIVGLDADSMLVFGSTYDARVNEVHRINVRDRTDVTLALGLSRGVRPLWTLDGSVGVCELEIRDGGSSESCSRTLILDPSTGATSPFSEPVPPRFSDDGRVWIGAGEGRAVRVGGHAVYGGTNGGKATLRVGGFAGPLKDDFSREVDAGQLWDLNATADGKWLLTRNPSRTFLACSVPMLECSPISVPELPASFAGVIPASHLPP